jgi:hypothetical protein
MSVNDMTDSMDVLADPDMWESAAATAGGYLGSSIAQSTLEGAVPYDVPNEAFGLGVAYAGYQFSPAYQTELATGGMIYTVDALAQRFGFKESVTNLGGA